MPERFPHFHLLIALLFLLAACQQGQVASYRPIGVPAAARELVFGVHPYLGLQDLSTAYAPLLARIEAVIPGTRLRLESARDLPAYEQKLREGRFHFALTDPWQALKCRTVGYRVIGKVTPDAGASGVLVARRDARLSEPGALRGRSLSFPAPTATAATLLPLARLHEEGLDPRTGFTLRYVGTDHSAILNAYAGDTAAAGASLQAWTRWAEENPEKAAEMQVLFTTRALPNMPLLARADLPPALAAEVLGQLQALSDGPGGDYVLARAGIGGFAPASEASYAPLAEFLRRHAPALGIRESGA